jgi:tetratricopeptide (TPR) repeat protein
LYVLDKRPDEAIKVLSGSIEKWPKVASFYEAMANIHVANQESEKAILVSQKGLENDPDNISLRMMLAAIYEKSKDYDKALENYEALISKHSNVDVAVNNLVSLLLDHYKTKENIDRAVKLAARFEKSEQPYFYDTYGWALLNSDRNDEALKVFKDVVAKMPEVAVFKYHLGLAYHKKNNNSAAIAELEQALAIGDKKGNFIEKEAVENLLKEIKAEKPV